MRTDQKMNKKIERVVPKAVNQTAKLNEEQWEKLNKLINAPRADGSTETLNEKPIAVVWKHSDCA